MKKAFFPILTAAALWGYGDGVIYWAPHVSHGSEYSHGEHTKQGGHEKRETTMLHAINSEGNSSVVLIKSDLSKEDLNLCNHTLNLPKASVGGYYALVLNHRTDNQIDSAIRYLSQQGRPSKISPTRLTALPKTDLEIVPNPMHREHDHYTASKTYRFLLAFKGTALPHLPVILETQNGSKNSFTTDGHGEVAITLPNDFKNVRVGKGDKKPSEFLLHAHYGERNILYSSALSMPYFVNPNDYWQSQTYGAGAIFIGFLGGLFLYRRNKKQGATRG